MKTPTIGKLYKNKKTGRIVKIVWKSNNKPGTHVRYQGMRKSDAPTPVPDPKASPYRIGVARFNRIFEAL